MFLLVGGLSWWMMPKVEPEAQAPRFKPVAATIPRARKTLADVAEEMKRCDVAMAAFESALTIGAKERADASARGIAQACHNVSMDYNASELPMANDDAQAQQQDKCLDAYFGPEFIMAKWPQLHRAQMNDFRDWIAENRRERAECIGWLKRQ